VRDGKKIGTHNGAHFYTIGQRKGLGIGGRKESLFVLATDVKENVIYVGEGDSHPGLYRRVLHIKPEEVHWVDPMQKMAVGDYRNAQKVFHCSMVYALAVGILGSLLLFFGAGALVPPNSVPVLQVFAPTVFLFGILGVLRGYFQANQSMLQTSVSQILEQIANAVVSIGAAFLLMRTVAGQGATTEAIHGAMGSALGTGSGVLVALIFMTFVYWKHRSMFMARVKDDTEHEEAPFGPLMRETILVITPFILSSFILNLTTSVNQTIFMKIMIGMRGWEEVMTTTLYGLFSNKAVVITNIPISIATAVAAAILPNISTSFAQGNIKETRKRSVNAIRMTLIIAVPCAVGLMALAKPVTMLLFPQWDTLDTASLLLAELAVTVVFYSVGTIMNAVLQSIGRIHMPLVSAGIALVIQTAVLVILILTTDLGVHALVLCSVLYSVLIFIIDSRFICKYLRMHLRIYRVYGRPVVAAAVMGIVTKLIYELVYRAGVLVADRPYFVNLIATVAAIVVAIAVYFFVLIRIGGLKKNDILQAPKGTKILGLLQKIRWI
jgi:stage V sporulation protein B